MNIYADFQARVAVLLKTIIASGRLPADLDLARFVVEPPRDPAHGDLAVNAAMVYAKEAKAHFANPRQLATELAMALADDPDVEQAEVAGPGFLNIRLKACRLRQDPAVPFCRKARVSAPARRLRLKRSMSNMSPPIRRGRCMSAMAAARSSATPSPIFSPSPGMR